MPAGVRPSLELLAEEPSGGGEDDESNGPTAFMQPEKEAAPSPAELEEESAGLGVESLSSCASYATADSSSRASGCAIPATIAETEADEFGGVRHLWSDGVWRPDGTEPHEQENVMKKNGVQYPIYLTLNPADGRYHVLKNNAPSEVAPSPQADPHRAPSRYIPSPPPACSPTMVRRLCSVAFPHLLTSWCALQDEQNPEQNSSDGRYHVLKDDTDEEKKSKFGTVESVGVVFAFPPVGWQRINIGRQLYERCAPFWVAMRVPNKGCHYF
jgi:hypothetical protein